MFRQCLKRKSPWQRERFCEQVPGPNPQCFAPEALDYVKENWDDLSNYGPRDDSNFLDIRTKRAALKASPSVVALVSYTGGQELIEGSGVIVESNDDNNLFVLTSATLIRHPTEEEEEDMVANKIAENLKVVMYLYDGRRYEGELYCFDFHYNMAAIRFQSDSPLPTASLRLVDDYINVNPTQLSIAEENSFELRAPSSSFSLVPGGAIIAVGRQSVEPFDLMIVPSEFSIDRCGYDCKELLMGTCGIARYGEGGPLVNLLGEVIGITFHDIGFTPFLPMNIVHKWWNHYKTYGGFRRPSLGIEATNFYAADVNLIEKVAQKFPSICNAVLVEKVIQGSSADCAGLHSNDVVVKCDGKTIRSFLEFLEMVWDKKVGDVLQLFVVQAYQNDPIHVNIVVDEVAVEKFNCWPRN